MILCFNSGADLGDLLSREKEGAKYTYYKFKFSFFSEEYLFLKFEGQKISFHNIGVDTMERQNTNA